MARFNGPSAAASAHAAMMRALKGKGGGGTGCAMLPIMLVAVTMLLVASQIA